MRCWNSGGADRFQPAPISPSDCSKRRASCWIIRARRCLTTYTFARLLRVSRATLYNTMDLLLDCKLVRKHQFGTAQAQFERAQNFRQHDHVICTACNKVMEFCDPRIQGIRNTVAEVMGFEVSHHALHIYGLCPDCIKERERNHDQHSNR